MHRKKLIVVLLFFYAILVFGEEDVLFSSRSIFYSTWQIFEVFETFDEFEGIYRQSISEARLDITSRSIEFSHFQSDGSWSEATNLIENIIWEPITLNQWLIRYNGNLSLNTVENFPRGYSIQGTARHIHGNARWPTGTTVRVYVFLHKDNPSILFTSFIHRWFFTFYRAIENSDVQVSANISSFFASHRTITRLRVRENPSTTSPIVTTLDSGTEVHILGMGPIDTIDGITASWKKILTSDGYTGWCFSGFLERVATGF